MALKAKPKQTLEGHLVDCHSVLGHLLSERQTVWEKVISRLQFNEQLFYDLLPLVIYSHDLGKSTLRWQNYLKTGRGGITHSLFSALILKELLGEEISNSPEGIAAILAVLAHHGMLHEGSFSGERFTGMGEQEIAVEEINEMLQRLNEDSRGNSGHVVSRSFTGAEGTKLVSYLRSAVQRASHKEKLYIKGVYTLVLSVLQLCDNEASLQYEQAVKASGELLGPVLGEDTKMRYIVSYKRAFSSFKESSPGKFPNKIQEEVLRCSSSFLILQAGCGVGKTAAALHYSAALAEKDVIDRVIMTLPTRFTTNSIYWDFYTQYGLPYEYTGIYHGEVESILLSTVDAGEAEIDRSAKDLKFENSFFNRPVNVCTVDHLLYSLLHCHKYADRAFGNLITSAVVFDEIHFYDAYTLQKIGQCMQLLRELQIPHLVMSATIPESVVNYLIEDAEFDGVQYDFLRQDDIWEEEEDRPFQIVKMTAPLLKNKCASTELLSLLEENISLRQMVVVNQVERAKVIARKIKERWPGINVICYHSEFSRSDRDEKEKVIRALFSSLEDRNRAEKELLEKHGLDNTEQLVLVSTQICEMSLNISSDVMYSEAAPADSVGQRGGRLHRKGRLWRAGDCRCGQCSHLPGDYSYYMYLFPLDWGNEKELMPYHGKINGVPILEKSWEVIGEIYSFSNVVQWVNELYPVPPDMEDKDMKQMILEDAVFGRKPSERFGDEYSEASGGSFKARHSDVITITVVPGSMWDESVKDPAALVKEHGVRVSLNKLRNQKDRWSVREVTVGGEKYKLHVLDLHYDWEFGFHF